MSTVLPCPTAHSPERLSWLIWQASQKLLAATREGRRDFASQIGTCLSVTREHPGCSPAMRRVIDSALSIALRRFGGVAPAFEPAQPDDGEAA